MGDIIRNCKYQAKNNFRDKGFLFWSLLYPVIMMTFFYMSFSGIMDFKLENVNIGIEKDNPIVYTLESIEFINITTSTEKQAEKLLNEQEIDGFIDGELNIKVLESGVNQTIIKEIVDQIKQVEKLDRPYESYDFSIDYVSDRNQSSNSFIVMFYSLIAMVAAYSVYTGVESVNSIQANMSNIGARINVSPLKKQNFLLAGGIVSVGLNLAANGLLIIFTKYVLGIELFYELKYSLLFILLGNLFGVSLGMFIGASSKKSINFKIAVCITTTLLMATLSGLLGPWIKMILDEKFGVIARFNPLSIISNNLYRANLLESTKGVAEGTIILVSYSVVLLLLSFVFLRRRKYDSI